MSIGPINEPGPPPASEGQVSVTITLSAGPAIIGAVTQESLHASGLVAGSPGMDGVGVVGVHGISDSGAGVHGRSSAHDGVQGRTSHPDHAGVSAVNEGGGIAVYGRGSPAGHFEGDLVVTGVTTHQGTVTMASGSDIVLADCAEEFTSPDATPGSVVVAGEAGVVTVCRQAYDPRAVGVVSGAGPFRPAVVLGHRGTAGRHVPVAMVGQVCCDVDAGYGAIAVGDLLTTSPTPGHAMRVGEPARALGTVVGKALEPLAGGRGQIRMLVALQ